MLIDASSDMPRACAGLMDREGFDLSQGLWQDSGWTEVEDLRRKLEALTELRELVRSLGRAGGKGSLRRAPEEVRGACCCPLSVSTWCSMT